MEKGALGRGTSRPSLNSASPSSPSPTRPSGGKQRKPAEADPHPESLGRGGVDREVERQVRRVAGVWVGGVCPGSSGRGAEWRAHGGCARIKAPRAQGSPNPKWDPWGWWPLRTLHQNAPATWLPLQGPSSWDAHPFISSWFTPSLAQSHCYWIFREKTHLSSSKHSFYPKDVNVVPIEVLLLMARSTFNSGVKSPVSPSPGPPLFLSPHPPPQPSTYSSTFSLADSQAASAVAERHPTGPAGQLQRPR